MRMNPQGEMFSAREMTPAIIPGKMKPTVPQAANGDDLLAGLRAPAPEPQGLPLDTREEERP